MRLLKRKREKGVKRIMRKINEKREKEDEKKPRLNREKEIHIKQNKKKKMGRRKK